MNLVIFSFAFVTFDYGGLQSVMIHDFIVCCFMCMYGNLKRVFERPIDTARVVRIFWPYVYFVPRDSKGSRYYLSSRPETNPCGEEGEISWLPASGKEKENLFPLSRENE